MAHERRWHEEALAQEERRRGLELERLVGSNEKLQQDRRDRQVAHLSVVPDGARVW